MPYIEFIVDSLRTFRANNYGMVELTNALPAAGRLYVAWSPDHTRPAYVGTSGNVRQRWDYRLAALNEVGVVPDTLQGSLVYTVRIEVNGVQIQPNDQGIAGGIDVEHLLIRIYYLHYNFGLRNTHLWNQPFQNQDPGGLYVVHTDPNHLVGGFQEFTNNAGGFAQLLPGVGQY